MDWYKKYVHREVVDAKLAVPIRGLLILVYPKQTRMFPFNITIKVAKCTKYEIKAYDIFRFLVRAQYFKFSFNSMRRQARLRL